VGKVIEQRHIPNKNQAAASDKYWTREPLYPIKRH